VLSRQAAGPTSVDEPTACPAPAATTLLPGCPMPGSQGLLVTAICAAFAVGVILPLPVTLRLSLARHVGGNETRTTLRLVFLLTLVPMYLVSGFLVDHWGLQEGLVMGALGTAVGLASLGLSREPRAALGAMALVGAGLALLHTALAALLPAAFAARPTTAASLGYLVVALGSLLSSQLLPYLEKSMSLRQGLLVLALVLLVPAGAAGFTPAHHFPLPQAAANMPELLADPRVWLAGLVLFLYYPLESLLLSWAPAYLAELGLSPRGAATVLAGYWAAFLATRWLLAIVPETLVPWLLLTLVVAVAVTLGNLSGSYRPTGGMWGLWTVGASLGPIFPSLIGLVFGMFPEHLALAFGIALAVGSCSGLLLEPVLESFARRHDVRHTMRLLVVASLVVAAPALVLCVLH
jgi:fucose permease